MRIRITSIVFPALAGIIAAFAVTCVLGAMTISGNAMEPSIPDGSIVFINKAAYFYQKPEPGDVVAFRCNVYSEDGEGSILVRRIAAVSGDRVRIADGLLFVNDKIYEGYSEKQIYLEPMDETVVGKDRMFVISDSQTAVLDSRDSAVGQLKTDELIGKVCFR
jgi:signal peptidase I